MEKEDAKEDSENGSEKRKGREPAHGIGIDELKPNKVAHEGYDD